MQCILELAPSLIASSWPLDTWYLQAHGPAPVAGTAASAPTQELEKFKSLLVFTHTHICVHAQNKNAPSEKVVKIGFNKNIGQNTELS